MAMPKSKPLRWFLSTGCLGILVALVLLILRPDNPAVILLLCPTSIAGLASPQGVLDKTIVAILIFGGNFLLYGAFGAIAGFAARER